MGVEILDTNKPYLYCDECGEDEGDFYRYDGFDYCVDCLLAKLKDDGVIEQTDCEEADIYGD